jgi:hypothetical protein
MNLEEKNNNLVASNFPILDHNVSSYLINTLKFWMLSSSRDLLLFLPIKASLFQKKIVLEQKCKRKHRAALILKRVF